VNATAFEAYLESFYAAFQRPLWVTEWACQNNNNASAQCSEDYIAQFMNQTQDYMDKSPFVERYAWFGAMENLQGVNPVSGTSFCMMIRPVDWRTLLMCRQMRWWPVLARSMHWVNNTSVETDQPSLATVGLHQHGRQYSLELSPWLGHLRDCSRLDKYNVLILGHSNFMSVVPLYLLQSNTCIIEHYDILRSTTFSSIIVSKLDRVV